MKIKSEQARSDSKNWLNDGTDRKFRFSPEEGDENVWVLKVGLVQGHQSNDHSLINSCPLEPAEGCLFHTFSIHRHSFASRDTGNSDSCIWYVPYNQIMPISDVLRCIRIGETSFDLFLWNFRLEIQINQSS